MESRLPRMKKKRKRKRKIKIKMEMKTRKRKIRKVIIAIHLCYDGFIMWQVMRVRRAREFLKRRKREETRKGNGVRRNKIEPHGKRDPRSQNKGPNDQVFFYQIFPF